MPIDDAIAELISTMSKGQYILLTVAIRQLGGELRIDPHRFAQAIEDPNPRMAIDASDGPVVIRVA